MKINETPFNFPNDNYATAAVGYSPLGSEGNLDLGDMDFLNMLNSLNAPVQQALQEMTERNSTQVVAKPKKDETSTKTESSNPKTALPLKAAVEFNRDDSLSEIKKEVDRLRAKEVTTGDKNFIQNILLPGIPFQGSVPLDTIFNAQGNTAEEGYQYQSLGISKRLSEMIKNAEKTGQSIRVDIDQNASLILKINQGRVSAEFLTADKSMELYLKQQLAELKTRMEEKNLPVGTLESRYQEQSSKQQKQQSNDDKS